MANFGFYNRQEYFTQLAKDVGGVKPGGRVAVATMTFDSTVPEIAALMGALNAAAARGVHVQLAVDANSFLWNAARDIPGPLWASSSMRENFPSPFGTWFHDLETLRTQGGEYAILNLPNKRFSVPQAGRSHTKASVVNDNVFIGGCNLRAPEELDLMVKWHDKKTADWLCELLGRFVASGSTKTVLGKKDCQFVVNDEMTIFVDAGVPNQSHILNQAWKLIDNAEKWLVLTCQYFPGGKTGEHLLAAYQRGVDVQIYYSPPKAHGKEAPAHHLYNSRERRRLPASFFAYELPKTVPKLHAKLLASEQAAMLGSHNYVTQGVKLGTAEMALLCKNPQFAKKALQELRHQLPTK